MDKIDKIDIMVDSMTKALEAFDRDEYIEYTASQYIVYKIAKALKIENSLLNGDEMRKGYEIEQNNRKVSN